jgi:sugar phosphate isomerase/epimerase
VSGLGNARLLVVNCLRERFTEISESDPIRNLKSQKHELRAERDARKAEIEILKAFGGKWVISPTSPPIKPTPSLNTLFEKTLACAETVAALDD